MKMITLSTGLATILTVLPLAAQAAPYCGERVCHSYDSNGACNNYTCFGGGYDYDSRYYDGDRYDTRSYPYYYNNSSSRYRTSYNNYYYDNNYNSNRYYRDSSYYGTRRYNRAYYYDDDYYTGSTGYNDRIYVPKAGYYYRY